MLFWVSNDIVLPFFLRREECCEMHLIVLCAISVKLLNAVLSFELGLDALKH